VRVFFLGEKEGTIVGVVEDFHTRSLHGEIEPLLLYQNPRGYARLLIRLQPGNPQPTVQELERRWKKIAPEYPFVYEFLDHEYDALYRLEQRVGTLIQAFTGLAMLVACFGLYGLSSYSTVQRTKEIGIRKVLGATVASIIGLCQERRCGFVVAFVIALPCACRQISGYPISRTAFNLNGGCFSSPRLRRIHGADDEHPTSAESRAGESGAGAAV
jgi:putative ABC transport system permease protein